MIGLGTIINVAAIVGGGLAGLLFGRFLKESWQQTIMRTTAVSTIFLGMAGTLSKMLVVTSSDGHYAIETYGSMMMILSLVIGAVVGELINIDGRFETFGTWLRDKSGNGSDSQFVNGFVTASLTVCIGAMAIIGAIQDGISHDPTTLMAKAVLDAIIIAMMTASLGKGCIFSAIPVGIWQGGITVLARLISPIMTDAALGNISLVGNILICCVGINLIWPRTIKVANLLPSLIFAVLFAFLKI